MKNKPLLGTLPEFRTPIESAHELESKIIDVFESWDDFNDGGERVLDADFYPQVAFEIKTLFKDFINENYEFKGKNKR